MQKQVLPITLLFFLSFFSINAGLAQTQPTISIKAGLSIPNLTSGSSSDPISTGYGSRLAPDAAVAVDLFITKHFSIQPQLEYSSQGGKKNGTQAFVVPADMASQFPEGQAPPYLYADYKSEARMNYLMLPVLAKFHFNSKKKWSTYAAAGPFVSYLLNAKDITSGSSAIYLDKNKTQPLTPGPQSFDSNDNITDQLHRVNVGISGHVGLIYNLRKSGIFVEAGGNYGLIDIQKNAVNGKNKTGAFVVDLGYQFGL